MKQFKFSNWKLICHILILSILFTNCQRDSSLIGLEIQPNSDKTKLAVFTHDSIPSYTVSGLPIIARSNFKGILGVINDSVFGKTKSDFIVQFGVFSKFDFKVVSSITDINLNLYSDGFSGDTAEQTIAISVYEIEKEISDSLYSDFDPTSLIVDTLASGIVDTVDFKAGYIQIPLPFEHGEELMETDTNIFDGDTIVKGYYITSKDRQDIGIIRYIDLTRSFVTVSFEDTSGTDKYFNFELLTKSKYESFLSHDYNGTSFESQIDDTSTQYNISYVQSMAGLKTKIKLPDFSWLKDSFPLVVNKAFFTIPADTHRFANENQTAKLSLSMKEDDVFIPIVDYRAVFINGSSYDTTLNGYSMNFTILLNDYILGDSDFPEYLYLTPSPNNELFSTNKAIIKNDSTNKISLSILYHKLN